MIIMFILLSYNIDKYQRTINKIKRNIIIIKEVNINWWHYEWNYW